MANKRNGYIIRAKDIDVKSSGALEISQSSGLGIELGVLYDGTSIKLNSSGQLSVGDISLTEEQMSSLQGVAGPQGPRGDKGETGEKGLDAHIGSVTASASQVEETASAEATVTTTSSSETNTTDFAFTFKIPKGSTGPQGPQGESGASGAPGKHARIGSVTASAVTIDESSSASVEVSESSSYNAESSENITDLAFTFHIPKGVKGDKGDTGSSGASGAPGKPARVGSVTATVSEISSDSSASVTVSESSNSDNSSENQTDLAFTFYLPKPAKGDRGETGPKGSDAKIGSVSASAETVADSESASASVSSSTGEDGATNLTFTFKIPRGSSGAQGLQGTSGDKGEQGPQGSAGADAHIGSITVKTSTLPESSEASVEVSQSESSGEEGNITDLAFTFYIPKGSSGTAGAQGSKGDAGAPGRSAKIGKVSAVASSAESTASVSVSQSSSSGSSEDVTDLTFTFFIPKGEKGDQGSSGSQGPAGPAGPAGKSIKLGSISAKAESLSYTAQPSVEVSASESSSDGDSSEVFENLTFTFKIPAGSPGEKGESGASGLPGEKGPAGERGLGIELRSVTASLMEEPAAEEAPAEEDTASVSVTHSSFSSSDSDNGSHWIHDLAFAFHIPKGPAGPAGPQGTSGPQGEQGEEGSPGKDAKVGSVKATVSMIESNSSASVSVTESSNSTNSSENQTDLDFTFYIPSAPPGPTGPSGDKGDTGKAFKFGSITALASSATDGSPSATVTVKSSSSDESTNYEDIEFTFFIPPGSSGPQGPQGQPGKDAKIGSVAAKVSMIPCTSEASVEVSSSSNSDSSDTDYTFTFHIPSGSPGPAGKDGSSGKDGASGASGMPAKIGSVSASIEMIATDSPASVDVVESSNSENTSENEKGFTFTFHIPSASPGPVGPAGKSGDRGETGPAGPSGSPGVGAAIRSVTASISPNGEEEEEETDSATVTLVHSSESSSTESGDVWYHDLAFTFHIPKGPKGDTGPSGASGSSGAKGDKGEHGIGMKLGSVTAAVSSISSGSPASVGISWGSSSSSDGTNGEVWTHDLGFTFYLPPGPQGPQGPQGTSGSSGAAGAKGEDGKSLKVGTVTTVTSMIPCTSSASVEVSASESSSENDSSEVFENFTFTFHIPSGSPGPKGDAGASGSAGKDGTDGKTLRVGSVTAKTSMIESNSPYSVEVSASESSSEGNSSELFEDFTFTFHIPSATPGAKGEDGKDGSPGLGFMIGSVSAEASPTTGSPSATVEITASSSDASLNYEDLKFTFYIPSGSPGKDGASGSSGAPGKDGLSFKIGKVTATASSLGAGSTPTASVSITSSSSGSDAWIEDLAFTFGIPEGSSGKAGEKGSDGKGFAFKNVTAKTSSATDSSASVSVSVVSSSSDMSMNYEDLEFTFYIPEGPAGKDAKLGSPTASASMLPPGASPTASVSSSGDESSPSFHFDFGIPGTIQAPMLMFTRPDYDSALHLEVQYKEMSSIPSDEPNGSPEAEEEDKDSSEYKKLLDTGDSSTGSSDCAKVFATANGSKWYKCPSSGFGAPFGGWPVAVDLTKCSSESGDGFDPTKRYYIKYRWYSTDKEAAKVIDAEVDSESSKNASDWYGMVYPPATEAPLSNSHKFVTTPPLLFTCPEFEDGLYLQVEYNDNPTSSGYQQLVDTSNKSSGNCERVKGNPGGNYWSSPPSSGGFGSNYAGWPVMVDVSGLLDPSTISYIRYRWVAKEDLSSSVEEVAVDGAESSLSDVASDWYYMVYPAATEAPPLSYHGDEQYWVEVSDTSGTLSLSPDDGELQKFKLTSSTNLIPPTLDNIHQTLLLQFELSSSVAFMLNSSSSLMSESSGTFHVGWYYDGSATYRYPVVAVTKEEAKSE